MEFNSSYLSYLETNLKASNEISAVCSRVWVYQEKTIVLDFVRYNNLFALDLTLDNGLLGLTVLGRTDSARRVLRNALIGKYEMTNEGGERHSLGRVEGSVSGVVLTCLHKIHEVSELIHRQVAQSVPLHPVSDTNTNVFWWDRKPNFGDVIGPWLISRLTGKSPVNGRGLKLMCPPLMTVGSTLSWLDQDGTTIWGSGLMNELSNDAVDRLRLLKDVQIHAVRGRLTRTEVIRKLGWHVPEVYGDPALLLPRFFPVAKDESAATSIVVVPHFSHLAHFQQLESETVVVVDVKDGMERVVRQIASARVCISTSLHGLIIAQAYGVPWVWARVSDDQLGGDTFKFRDFFSTLDSSAVSAIDVCKQDIDRLDLEELAQRASLPELQISLDDLLQSFPLTPQPMVFGEGWHHTNMSQPRAEEPLKAEDIGSYVQSLLQKMDTIAEELAEQRRLLELLAEAH